MANSLLFKLEYLMNANQRSVQQNESLKTIILTHKWAKALSMLLGNHKYINEK